MVVVTTLSNNEFSLVLVSVPFVGPQDAFWALVVLIGSPKFAMHGMLIPGLPKLLAYCDLHGRIRRRYLPRLDRHLVSVGVCFSNDCMFIDLITSHSLFPSPSRPLSYIFLPSSLCFLSLLSLSLTLSLFQNSHKIEPTDYCTPWFVKFYLDAVSSPSELFH